MKLKKQEISSMVKKKGKLLVLDDDKIIQGTLQRIFENLNQEVEIVENGEAAITQYRKAMKSDHPYDAAILDLTIPGAMGGQEAAKIILEIDPSANLIVSSGYFDNPVMANFKEYGFKEVLGKPYTLQRLIKVLNKVL